jgi:ATPase subunit of ABC transporter with duplicated ATPase domains
MPATLIAAALDVDMGRRRILDGVGVQLAPGQRIGLVGPNGVGKSTLLRVLAGRLTPDKGKVTLAPPEATVGFLVQEPERTPNETARELLARRTGVNDATIELEASTADLAIAAAGADDRYSIALDRWLALGGADFDARLEDVWHDLGLDASVLDRPMTALSGGEAARVGLAALLLSRFDVYLLDEPTNDLDLDGLARLEDFVLSTDAPQLIVSHDRTFLERVVTHVVELDEHSHKASLYGGGWSGFLSEKATSRRHAEEDYANYSNQKSELVGRAQRERDWATQGVIAHKQKQSDKDVAGRKFRQEKTEQVAARASRTERAMERLEVVDKPWEGWDLRLEIATAPRAGNVVARLSEAVVDRGEFRLGPITLEIGGSERVAILGSNGSGKTTLLRALLGEQALTSGQQYLGPGIMVGGIDQARERFEGSSTLLEAFMTATGFVIPEARTLLAKFGLGAEHVNRSSSSLSPGERTRAVLALLQAKGVNCLVLDEPTNHLDLRAIEQLEQALESFAGTVLLVTHDRQFLKAVRVDRIIQLDRGAITSDAPV